MFSSSRVSSADLITPISNALYKLATAFPDSGIEDDLKHLVSLRSSQLNGCAFCLSMHVRDLRNAGWREDKIAVVPAWRETDWFTPREQAALAWTEALTRLDGHGISEDLYTATRDVFGERDLAALTAVVIAINGWNRQNAAFHVAPEHFESPVNEQELATTV